MRSQSLVIGALIAVCLSLVSPATAKADQQCPEAGTGEPAAADSQPFPVPAPYSGNILGPNTLPTGPVKRLLVGYQRLGTPPLEPKAFLDKYYDQTNGWKWPTNFGFAGEAKPFTMKKGHLFDRFGKPDEANFLANEKHTPFASRGLPPQSLNTYKGSPEANYHVYCVVKELTVQYGKIKDFAGQPGGGYQYFLGNTRVKDLLAAGQLIEVPPKYGLDG